jgi:hypothetical protein
MKKKPKYCSKNKHEFVACGYYGRTGHAIAMEKCKLCDKTKFHKFPGKNEKT